MLALLAAWGLLYLVVSTMGALAAVLLFAVRRSRFDHIDEFWIGMALLLAYLELYSLVAAIDRRAWIAPLAMAVLGLPVWLRLVRRRGRRRSRRGLLVRVLAVALSTAIVANSALAEPSLRDTLSTHLQQARWIKTFAVVPGLANLNSLLGFDSAGHVFAAFTDVGWWQDRSVHVANGFLVAALGGHLVLMAADGGRALAAFAVVAGAFLVTQLGLGVIPSLSSDIPMEVLSLVAVAEWLRLGERASPRADYTRVAALLAAAGAALAAKPSGLALFCTCVLGGMLRLRPAGRPSLLLLLLPSLLVLAAAVRRIILTGWLLYPVPWGNLHLDWSVPPDMVRETYSVILTYARVHQSWAEDSRWLGPWCSAFVRTPELTLLLATAALSAVRLARSGFALPRPARWAAAAALVSIAYWFITAPLIRFGAVFFWILFALSLAPLAERLPKLTFLGPMACVAGALAAWGGGTGLRLAPSFSALRAAPVPPNHPFVIESGQEPPLRLNVPDGWACGDAALPCTPYPARQRWRLPGSLAGGFLPSLPPSGDSLLLTFDRDTSALALKRGWSDFERGADGQPFVWATSRSAEIELFYRGGGDRLLRFHAWPFRFEGAPQETVALSLNGTPIGSVTLGSEPASYALTVPARAWRQERNQLRFDFAYASPPVTQGMGRDRRLRAVAFDRLEVTRYNRQP